MMPVAPLWPTAAIGDLFDIRQGKSLSRREQTGRQRKRFLRTSNVLWGRIDLTKLDEMDFSQDECDALALRPNDLLVCEGGDIGRTAIWRGELSDCYYQNHLHRLRARDDRAHPAFVMFWMQAAITQLGLYDGFGNRTTIPNLSRSRLSEFKIPLPPLPEQRKIAAVLGKVQEAIAAEAALVRNARDLKQSLLHHLFTHGLRNEPLKQTEIGRIPRSWDLRDCESLCAMITVGVVVQPARHYVASGIPAFRSLNIQEDRLDTKALVFFSREANDGILGKSKLRVDDVLVVRTGYPGTSCVVPPEFDGSNCIDLVIARPHKHVVCSGYLSRFFNSSLGRSQVLATRTGLAQQHINVGAVKRLTVPLPPLDEQRAIANILQTADDKIYVHEARQCELKDLFKALLHQLMTGRVRVDGVESAMETTS